MTLARLGCAAGLAALLAGFGTTALADGGQPFYGYSPYFGQPAPYFTPDNDVRQATSEEGGSYGFGTRTYYRGGPFWHYRPVSRTLRPHDARRSARHARVLRRRY